MPSKTPKPIDLAHCQARADECEREAERAAEPELKKTYLDLARAWRDVADDITNNRLLASPRRRAKGAASDEMA
jgi:hypothetical protein